MVPQETDKRFFMPCLLQLYGGGVGKNVHRLLDKFANF